MAWIDKNDKFVPQKINPPNVFPGCLAQKFTREVKTEQQLICRIEWRTFNTNFVEILSGRLMVIVRIFNFNFSTITYVSPVIPDSTRSSLHKFMYLIKWHVSSFIEVTLNFGTFRVIFFKYKNIRPIFVKIID